MKSSKPRRRMLRNLALIVLLVFLIIAAMLGVVHHRAQRELNVWLHSPEYRETLDRLQTQEPSPAAAQLKAHQEAINTSTKEQTNSRQKPKEDDLLYRFLEEKSRVTVKRLREETALREEVAAYLEERAALLQWILQKDNHPALRDATWVDMGNDTLIAKFEGYDQIRELTRLAIMKSYYEAATDQPDAAWSWLVLGNHLANTLQEDSPILGLITMSACQNRLREAAEHLMQVQSPSADTWRQLDSVLRTSTDPAVLHNALQFELVYSTDMHHRNLEQMQGIGALFARPISNYFAGQLFDAEQEFIALTQQESVEMRLQAYQALSDTMNDQSMLARITLPSLIRAAQNHESHVLETDLLRLSLAAEQYQSMTGSYPTSINAIEALLTAPLANPDLYTATLENGRLILNTLLPEHLSPLDLPEMYVEHSFAN